MIVGTTVWMTGKSILNQDLMKRKLGQRYILLRDI
jgi:hypothetical protein